MHGFRTKTLALAAIALALLAGPALASGVGGDNYTDTSMATMNGGTNVTVDKNIDTSSNVSVNKVINGVNVGYGLSGATVLNGVNNQTGDAANYNQGRESSALGVEGAVLNAIGLPNY